MRKRERLISKTLPGKAFNRILLRQQTEVYLDINKMWVNKFVTREGQRAFMLTIKKGNALANGIIAAWDTGYREQQNFLRIRFGVTSTYAAFRIRNVIIRAGRRAWGAREDKLYFVVLLGQRVADVRDYYKPSDNEAGDDVEEGDDL